MGDCIKTVTIKVDIQENGIIRIADTGLFIGRLDGVKFEEVAPFDLEAVKIDNTARFMVAVENAEFMLEEYKKIPAGVFGAIGIANAIQRYKNGERTDELLEELEGIQ